MSLKCQYANDNLTPLKTRNFERRINALLLHERHRVFVLSNLLNFKANIMYGTKYLFSINVLRSPMDALIY